MTTALKLGVNIDHVATLRQARGTAYPDPLEAARMALKAGADSITVHLREDRRHIQDGDVQRLRAEPHVFLNLEMANVPEIVHIACDLHPDEVCLVPEKREERTTEGGLDIERQFGELGPTVKRFAENGIRVSLFLEPALPAVHAAACLGVQALELHTGRYAEETGLRREAELQRIISAASRAHDLGLQVNAGHGLNLANVHGLRMVPWLDTLNIGHSIISRAVIVGLAEAVREMLREMQTLRSPLGTES